MNTTNLAIDWMEQGLVPDRVIRAGIRRLLKQRLSEIRSEDSTAAAELSAVFAGTLHEQPVALVPDTVNQQHYEVPAVFFAKVLGQHRKYSACWWPPGTFTLDDAESAALAATCERARLADGQQVLELGCGWGSLVLWMARAYPRSHITAVSNSQSQRGRGRRSQQHPVG